MYDTKEEALKSEAGKIKRKRNSYWNAIVYDADGNPTYKVLRDTTNEGKLTRILCQVMGIPFFRDVEDNWVVKLCQMGRNGWGLISSILDGTIRGSTG